MNEKNGLQRGLPIVISAPSGGGKSTLATRLLSSIPLLKRSISITTRAPRPGEKNGDDYYFLAEPEFREKVNRGEFLEWANVHGNLYGTPIEGFEERLRQGFDVILTIDPQGAASVRRVYPAGLFVFLVPPTWEVLEKRLRERATDDEAVLATRIAGARNELQCLAYYDYLVVNDSLDDAVSDVSAIIRAEHRRISRLDPEKIPILKKHQ